MPLIFTKDQIRRYLSEMGYDELNDEHLDRFIRDLKKLIKHEDKKRRTKREHRPQARAQIDLPDSSVQESSSVPVSRPVAATKNIADAGQASTSTRRKWKDRPLQDVASNIVPSIPAASVQNKPEFESKSSSSSSSSSEDSSLSSSVTTDSDVESRLPKRAKYRYTGRADPVARYHFYKSLWDKQKAPGEDRHMQLRWNVRAGTMGKVPCDPLGSRVKYLR